MIELLKTIALLCQLNTGVNGGSIVDLMREQKRCQRQLLKCISERTVQESSDYKLMICVKDGQ